EIQNKLTQRIFNNATYSNVGMSTPEKVARWAGGTIVDLADSVYGNKLIPGTSRGDVWSLFEGTDEAEFYKRNQQLVAGSSALVGMLATGIVGGVSVLPRIGNALARSTALTGTRAWQAGSR